jgi:hypothetical protein
MVLNFFKYFWFTDKDLDSSLSEEEQSTATISYTLKDNDPANLFSVDVVNLFDGMTDFQSIRR